MSVSSSNISFILIVALNVVQGSLTPNGNVSVDCGRAKTFTCNASGEPLKWTTSGLRGISRGPFMARKEAIYHPRMWSPDTGGDTQVGESSITISGFSRSDNGGTIQCINANNSNVRGMASISVGLRAPANVMARAESCDTVTLMWDQPSRPNNITTSVNCTPPSPGCAECTTSPCIITGLNPSTEYVFTVTLNSVMCGTSMNTTGIGARDLPAPTNIVATVESHDTVTLQWDQPSEPADITVLVRCTPPSPDTFPGGTSSAPLAALVLLVLLIPVIYPLGVLIAIFCCFRNKGYCEVFWCCGCFREDKSPKYNSTELMKSPHPREEEEYQNVNKGKHIQFVNDGEENKDQMGNRRELVGTYETVEQLEDDGDVVTDETVEQQGYEDWITYADLDFSGQLKENNNVVHSIGDEIKYAAV